jgi:hypothetical protein
MVIEEVLIGVLFLIFFDSGVSRDLMPDVAEINYGACSGIASGQGEHEKGIEGEQF